MLASPYQAHSSRKMMAEGATEGQGLGGELFAKGSKDKTAEYDRPEACVPGTAGFAHCLDGRRKK